MDGNYLTAKTKSNLFKCLREMKGSDFIRGNWARASGKALPAMSLLGPSFLADLPPCSSFGDGVLGKLYPERATPGLASDWHLCLGGQSRRHGLVTQLVSVQKRKTHSGALIKLSSLEFLGVRAKLSAVTVIALTSVFLKCLWDGPARETAGCRQSMAGLRGSEQVRDPGRQG